MSLVNNVIMFGLPYDCCSWLMMLMMDIVEFHPVRAALLDTLNCAATVESSMQKQAHEMFL